LYVHITTKKHNIPSSIPSNTIIPFLSPHKHGTPPLSISTYSTTATTISSPTLLTNIASSSLLENPQQNVPSTLTDVPLTFSASPHSTISQSESSSTHSTRGRKKSGP
ncbi:hypothetical protein Salat_1892500, partial [Sesamum alatum]